MTGNGASKLTEARIPSARNAANDSSDPHYTLLGHEAAACCDEQCTSSHGCFSTPTERLHVTVRLAIGPSFTISQPKTSPTRCSL